MKQRILLLGFLAVVIAALIGLNAVSYTRKDLVPDSEFSPNRSSYNSGATGTSAFYALLAETGNKVTRWQQPVAGLLAPNNSRISTFVLIGKPRREVTEEEAEKILAWVSRGGRLVLVDRDPELKLVKGGANWKLTAVLSKELLLGEDSADQPPLTEKIVAAKPVQPTVLMRGISAVQPSSLASQISIEYEEAPPPEQKSAFKITGTPLSETPPAQKTPLPLPSRTPAPTPTPGPLPAPVDKVVVKKTDGPTFSPTPKKTDVPFDGVGVGKTDAPDAPEEPPKAPVIHLSNPERDILADLPYGNGRILLLSDPYILSNAGIKLVDNATLGINLAAVKDGTIAFDEYHQGFGSENTFLSYFAGTPVPALAAQAFLLVLVLLWTQGRRFARPLPMPAKDRRSKLEYIGAMADLQQSTRAYDLAVENVYSQTKRNLMRLVSADNTVSKKQLAEAVAARSGFATKDLYILMSKCEDIIHGEPTNARKTMNLISQLRVLEEKLGLNRTKTSKVK